MSLTEFQKSISISRDWKDIFKYCRWYFRRITSFARVLPDFILLGEMKSGTTTVYDHIVRHPNIIPPLSKDSTFYHNYYWRGVNWYRSYFPSTLLIQIRKALAGSKVLTGEACVDGLFHPLVAERIARINPKCKIIIVLRNPVDRAYSHYQHETRKGRETLSFKEAINQESSRTAYDSVEKIDGLDYVNHDFRRFSYLARGHYADHIQRVFNHFPREQVLILRSEDYFQEPRSGLNKIFEFLSLNNAKLRDYPVLNVGHYSPIPTEIRELLVQHYTEYNTKLYQLTGEDFGWD